MNIAIRTVAAALLAALALNVSALEEPEYEVIQSFEEFELREYAPYIVAEVDVTGDMRESGNSAFRILAGYIFGDNEAKVKMEMTAPVSATSTPPSEKMAMTAPVASSVDPESGVTTYSFVMERKYTMDTLPEPLDDRIRIREVPPKVMAVRKYSGRWTQSTYEKHLQQLQSALLEAEIKTTGEPILARYNSPFSLPVFRRNEVMLEALRQENPPI